MIKGDSIYQVLLRYDFDLMRGNEGIAEYINDHLNKYYSDMNEAISKKNDFLGSTFIGMLKEKMPLLNELCKDIPSVLFDFDNGHIQKAYNDSVVLFDKLKPYLLQRLSRADYCGDYYRIRQGDFRITDPTQSKQQKWSCSTSKDHFATESVPIGIVLPDTLVYISQVIAISLGLNAECPNNLVIAKCG